MPNGNHDDYMGPSSAELNNQKAARGLVYTLRCLGKPVDGWLRREAGNCYSQDERVVPLLCEVLGSLSDTVRDWLIYDARDREARNLADWYEDHQKAER